MLKRHSPAAPAWEALPLPRARETAGEGAAAALNVSHALQLQYEYDEWRDRIGLNPTEGQVRKLKRLASALAQATGEVVA